MSARNPVSTRIRVLQIGLIVAVSLASFATLTLPISLRSTNQSLTVGDVAQITLQSPRDIEYVSDIRTEESRKAAESAVQPVYSQPDPAIARQQIERLRTAMQYITTVRANPGFTVDERDSNLVALSDVRLQLATIDYVLGISDSAGRCAGRSRARFELSMRRAIYEDKVESTQAGISSCQPHLERTAIRARYRTGGRLHRPEQFFSEELTTAARQAARDNLKPIVQTYKTGETIVPSGEIITRADVEAFQQLGMMRPGQRCEDMLGAAAIILLSAALVPLYLYRRKRLAVMSDPRSLFVVAVIFVVFLIGARLFTDRTLAPYGYPLHAAGLLLTTLFGLEVGFVISIPLCLLAAYGLSNTFDLAPYYLLTSLVGLLALGPARRFWCFLRAGIAITLSGFAVLMAYRLPFFPPDWLGIVYFWDRRFSGFAAASITLLFNIFSRRCLAHHRPNRRYLPS